MDATSFRHGLYDENFEKDACGIGLVVNASKPSSHLIIQQGLEILKNLAHRSALGADGRTSDGAGLMTQIPDAFFRRELTRTLGADPLPAIGDYGVAQIFLPHATNSVEWVQRISTAAENYDLQLLATREVPTNSSVLGPLAQDIEPVIQQMFFDQRRTTSQKFTDLEFQSRLSALRSWCEIEFRQFSACRDPETGKTLSQFYICSFSTRTMIYKGLMQPKDLGNYFRDLCDDLFHSQFAMVHSRFSTNTLPAWELAQPFRWSCHNGEINTIFGNRQWMKARGFRMTAGRSDSNSFDEALEHLLLGGHSLVEAMMILVPEPWEKNDLLDRSLKNFYAFHALRMEPWDGPAALCVSQGAQVGLCLDRNGLRPCRYEILKDGTLIAGSEAGTLQIPAQKILRKGQLAPGQLVIVDLKTGHIDLDNDLKLQSALKAPFGEWCKNEIFPMPSRPEKKIESPFPNQNPWPQLARFGFHFDEILQSLVPLFENQEEPLSSMGYDTPLPLLSDHPQLLSQYFRQSFAQVTNPPMDSLREKSVMSLTTYLGARARICPSQPDGKKRWKFESPLLAAHQLNTFVSANFIDTTFDVRGGPESLRQRIADICLSSADWVRGGADVLVLSDRLANSNRAAIPPLLMVSAIHHHLIKVQLRLETSLVSQSGEIRDSHQIASLISFGADAVQPYSVELLATELIGSSGWLKGSAEEAFERYRAGISKSLLKVMSKLGISTLQSYCGSQAFEILGLSEELVNEYFPGTATRMGGLDLEILTEEILRRWQSVDAVAELPSELSSLPSRGDVHYRSGGEFHQWNPQTLTLLQSATRENNFESFKVFSDEVRKNERFTLRGHLGFKETAPLPISEIESATDIVKSFTTGAMSLGALSAEAHEGLAIAMNRMGAKSNSGEGGEDGLRFRALDNGDSKNSAIKQIASGRFGVTARYLVNAQELQIKMAQGAKPGEGGQLSGSKVDSEIARIRHSTPGVTLISPPPHHDIYSIEDLAQLIFDLQAINPTARISVKLVAKAGVGTIAAGVAKAKAGKILISGDGGGTGASPLSSIRHAGIPWEFGLAETHQTLLLNGLRSQVKLEADGQLRTGRDVVIAAILGADEFGFSTAPLVVQGCLMMRKCHLNTCPVGIATQDPELRKKFTGQPEHVINYFFFVAEEVREHLARLGVRKLADLVGRTDLLTTLKVSDHWKTKSMDLARLLTPVDQVQISTLRPSTREKHFDQIHQLTKLPPSLNPIPLKIKNTDRSIGTWTSGEITREQSKQSFSPYRTDLNFEGSSGQSLGAFLESGIRLRVSGEANDYVGKGLSGGRIVVNPLPEFSVLASESAIVGNTCLYGATSGEAFFAGRAGERFAVRNSGAIAVVEGVGHHACEYMTGGKVVVLGSTGSNFGAGMSGGWAFVFDEHNEFRSRCNLEMIEIENLSDLEDETWLLHILAEHRRETGSVKADKILKGWRTFKLHFRKILPKEYRKIMAAQKKRTPQLDLPPIPPAERAIESTIGVSLS